MSTRGGPVRRARCVEPPGPRREVDPRAWVALSPVGLFHPRCEPKRSLCTCIRTCGGKYLCKRVGWFGGGTARHAQCGGKAGGPAPEDRCPVVAEGGHREAGFMCAKRTPGRGERPGVGRRGGREPTGRRRLPQAGSGGGIRWRGLAAGSRGRASRGGYPGQGLGNRRAGTAVRSSAPGSRGGSPPWRRAAAPGWRGGPSSARSGGCRRTCRSTGRCSAAPGRPRRAAGGWGSAGC